MWTTHEGNTALAFVNLDADGERSFDFYVDNAAHKHISEQDLSTIDCDKLQSSFLFGFLGPELIPSPSFDEQAKENGMMVCLDLNYRNVWDHQRMLRHV